VANDLGANWCAATSSFGLGDLGTPGAANDACNVIVPTGDTGTPPPWSAFVIIDGDPSDFPPDTTFAANSGSTVRVAWNETYLYLAVSHPDIATGGDLHWVTAYLGDAVGGTTTGVQHGTQQPYLPFGADALWRYKADSTYAVLTVYDAYGWGDLASDGDAEVPTWAESGDTLEVAIPWASTGVTERLFALHVAQQYEGAGYESTYGGLPTNSFVDGYDPDYGSYLWFDRDAITAPAVQGVVLP